MGWKGISKEMAMTELTADAELMLDGLDRIADAARFLKVSVSTVYTMLDRGDLPSVKIGKCRRIPHRALLRLAADSLLGSPAK
jgi:excisionase family DNA binding protein